MKVVIAGGSGMIGRHLARSLVADGHQVDVLTRDPGRRDWRLPPGVGQVGWTVEANPALGAALAGADAVVNLAGVSLGPRPWTSSRKRAILSSRLDATEALVGSIATLPAADRPRVLLNASGTDVYTGRDAEPATESTSPADDFLARVCIEWEARARAAEALGVRVVVMRQAFVLAGDAPVLGLMTFPFRIFAGGRLGSGKQWFSWIHVDDLVALYRWAVDADGISGAVNAAAPEPCRNSEFAATVGRVLHRPNWLPAPSFVLRLALRDQVTLVLGSRRAVPRRALDAGFSFRFPGLEAALRDVLA